MMRPGVCIHYNSSVVLWGVCGAGNDVRGLVGGENFGWLCRIPCMKENNAAFYCRLYEEPITDDIAAYEADLAMLVNRMKKIEPLLDELRRTYQGFGHVGTIKCPECKGVLHVKVARGNGHVKGKCVTDGCYDFQE